MTPPPMANSAFAAWRNVVEGERGHVHKVAGLRADGRGGASVADLPVNLAGDDHPGLASVVDVVVVEVRVRAIRVLHDEVRGKVCVRADQRPALA